MNFANHIKKNIYKDNERIQLIIIDENIKTNNSNDKLLSSVYYRQIHVIFN